MTQATKRFLIASDLDGTLIPLPRQVFNPESLRQFKYFLRYHPQFRLVFVSGRNKSLVKQAMRCFALPQPAAVIGNVGTTIFLPRKNRLVLNQAWRKQLLKMVSSDFVQRVQKVVSIPELFLQGPAGQREFKCSYYLEPAQKKRVLPRLHAVLKKARIKAEIVYSEDQSGKRGLVDVLPKNGSKAFAVEFLRKKWGISKHRVLIAGDSGNDFGAMLFGFKAVLTGNARVAIKKELRQKARQKKCLHNIFFARQSHALGILEALAFFGWLA